MKISVVVDRSWSITEPSVNYWRLTTATPTGVTSRLVINRRMPQSQSYVDTDVREVFETYSIEETQSVQKKINHEIERKREELRMLVGYENWISRIINLSYALFDLCIIVFCIAVCRIGSDTETWLMQPIRLAQCERALSKFSRNSVLSGLHSMLFLITCPCHLPKRIWTIIKSMALNQKMLAHNAN